MTMLLGVLFVSFETPPPHPLALPRRWIKSSQVTPPQVSADGSETMDTWMASIQYPHTSAPSMQYPHT